MGFNSAFEGLNLNKTLYLNYHQTNRISIRSCCSYERPTWVPVS